MIMTIGQRIKARRKELDMSADTLAEKLGKSRATVFRYENGDIKNLPLDILKPIADALNTTPAYLMGWYEEQINDICCVREDVNYNCDTLESLYKDLVDLELTESELYEVYQYAQFIKNKRG